MPGWPFPSARTFRQRFRERFAALGNYLVGLLVDHLCTDAPANQLGGLVGPDVVELIEQLVDIFVAFVAQGPQQQRHGKFPLPVDVDEEHVVHVQAELQPGAVLGNDAGGIELLAVGVGLFGKEHAVGTLQLGYDDAFGAVDDEGALLRDQGELAEEDGLLYDVLDLLAFGFCVFTVGR